MHATSATLEVSRPRFATPLSASFLTSVAVQGLNVVTGILLARALGPGGRGQLTAVLLWPFVLAAIGSIGITESVTYYAARGTPAGRLVGTVGAVAVLQSAVLVGIGFLLIPKVLSGQTASTVTSARLFLAVIPLNLLILYLMGVLNGLHRYGLFNALRLLVIAATAVGLGICWVGDTLTVRAGVIVYLAAHVLTLAGAVIGVATTDTGRLEVDRRVAPKLLAFGLKSHSSSVPSMLNERLDQLVIAMFLAPVSLGLYVIAVTMTSVTNLIGSSVSFVALPAVARLAPGEERTAAARRFVVLTVLISTIFTIPFLVFTGPLIDLLFGQDFRGATNVCRVLLVGAVALSTTRAVGAILKAVNRPLDAGIAETLALVVTVVLLAALLPTMGIMGAGVASLAAYAIGCAFSLRQAARALGIASYQMVLPTRADLRMAA